MTVLEYPGKGLEHFYRGDIISQGHRIFDYRTLCHGIGYRALHTLESLFITSVTGRISSHGSLKILRPCMLHFTKSRNS